MKKRDEFDTAGEAIGYISLDQAVLQARRMARQDDQRYLQRLGWDEIVRAEISSEQREDSYRVVLQFRRPARGLREEQTGEEEFIFDLTGELQDRQVLVWPEDRTASAPVSGPLDEIPTPLPASAPQPTVVWDDELLRVLGGFLRQRALYVDPDIPPKLLSDAKTRSALPETERVLGLVDLDSRRLWKDLRARIGIATMYMLFASGGIHYNSSWWSHTYGRGLLLYAEFPNRVFRKATFLRRSL